jgi:hypothetical protein
MINIIICILNSIIFIVIKSINIKNKIKFKKTIITIIIIIMVNTLFFKKNLTIETMIIQV